MHTSALITIAFCVTNFLPTTQGGKVVVDFRFKADDKVEDLSKKTKFLFFCEKKLDEVFKYFKGTEPKPTELELSISDACVFLPGGGKKQVGFRRAEVLPKYEPKTVETGKKIYHHSLKLDSKHPMNASHQYIFASLEDPKLGSSIYDIMWGTEFQGTRIGKFTPDSTANDFKVRDFGRKTFATIPASKTGITNFAIEVDFTSNTLQVHSSKDQEPLKKVGEIHKNDEKAKASYGNCELHVQLIKFPMANGKDKLDDRNNVPFFGIQPLIKDKESVLHSRVFVEEAPLTTDPNGPSASSNTTSTTTTTTTGTDTKTGTGTKTDTVNKPESKP